MCAGRRDLQAGLRAGGATLASDPQPILPAGRLPADLVRLRQQPRPCSRSASRQRSPKRRPTTGPASGPCLRPPLGTVPLSPHATLSSRAQDYARRPVQPSYHEGSRTWPLRINPTGSPVDCHRSKKAYERGLSWPPSGPRALMPPSTQTIRTHVATSGSLPLPLPTTRLAHTPAGWGHGGTR